MVRLKQDKRAEIEFMAKTIDVWEAGAYFDPKHKEKELERSGILQARNQLILDAGCGAGVYGLILARKGNNVVGVDISRDILKVAKHRADGEPLNYSLLAADVESLPLKDNTVDGCLCVFILHHFPDMEPPVAELYRVLKPGGTIFLIEPNGSNPVAKLGRMVGEGFLIKLVRIGYTGPNERRYSHRHYLRALEKAGFGGVRFSSDDIAGLEPRSRRKHISTPSERLLYFLSAWWELAFSLSAKVLPQPYKYSTLYMTGVKPAGDNIEV